MHGEKNSEKYYNYLYIRACKFDDLYIHVISSERLPVEAQCHSDYKSCINVKSENQTSIPIIFLVLFHSACPYKY